MAQPEKSLPDLIGEMTVLWNDCQAIVFALFFLLLEAPLPKAKAVFFSIPSDLGQRRAAQALAQTDASTLAVQAAKIIEKFGKMNGARNAFTHAAWTFPAGSGAVSNWLDTWKDEIAGNPVKKCKELIGRLEQMHTDLRDAEAALREALSGSPGASPRESLALPLRQNSGQMANAASQAQQQPSDQSLASPQQAPAQSP